MGYLFAARPGTRGRCETARRPYGRTIRQSPRPVEAHPRRRRRTRARRLARRFRDAGRHAGSEALEHQRVHHLLQLLLVRMRNGCRRPGRQAGLDGRRLRPHREPRILVRQRHLHVRHARVAEAADDAPLPGAGKRPLGGAETGRTRPSGLPERSRRSATRPGSRPRSSATRRFRSTGPRRSPSSAARRTRTRSATSSRRRPGCSACRSSSTRPDFDTAPRSPVWGQRSGGGR